jgi:hypothetical protein
VAVGEIGEGRFGRDVAVLRVEVVLGVGAGELRLILGPGLCFTAVAFLAEREVEVVTYHANPITRLVLGLGTRTPLLCSLGRS